MTALGRVSVVLALAPAALVAPASAQMASVTPYFGVIATDEALLRCGDSDLMYPVAKLSKGQLLRIDGEGKGWARVSYPSGTSLFVPADAVQLDPGGKTATVTKPTRLKAANMTTGLKGSWKDVLDQPLAAGAKLTVIEAEPTPDGRGSSSYRVAPPEAARAFISLTSVQKATQEQINAYTASQASRPAEPAPKTQPPIPKPATPEPAKPATGPTSLTDPMKPPAAGTPAPTGATGATGAAPSEATQPTIIEQKPVPVPPSPYERLEAAFDAIRRQPPDQAEYGELMNEFQAAIDKLDDSPQSRIVRPRLQLRLDYLKLQADVQDQLRKLDQAQRNISESDKALQARLAEVDRVRQYTIVGRLSASPLYDGKRMPLMYRVQAVGGASPRTLAYLKPDEKLKIESKIGQVVGVLGDATVDPTLKLRIITPLRVDTLEPAAPAPAPTGPTGASPSAEAPKPVPTGG